MPRTRPTLVTRAVSVAIACLGSVLLSLSFAGGMRSGPEPKAPERAAKGISLIEDLADTIVVDSTDTIVVGGRTLRAFPLVKASTESVGLAASTVGALVGYAVPVVGGVVLSSVLAWLWMEAGKRNISPQMDPDDPAYAVAKDIENVANTQGMMALQTWNLSAKWINRSF